MNIKGLFVCAAIAFSAVPALPLTAAADPTSAVHKTGEYIEDSALTTKVKAALLAEKNLKSLPISVESTEGVVTLSGKLSSSTQVDQAVDVTKHVKGVKDVHNALELASEQ